MAVGGTQPGNPLKLSNAMLELLGVEISGIIDDLEQDHTLWFDDIANWWRWYEAVPQNKVKNWPFKDSSNIVVPVIRISADNVTARYHNQIFATEKMWVGTSDNPEFADRNLKPLVKFDNWSARHDLHVHMPVTDYLGEQTVIGESHLALSYRKETMDLADPKTGKVRNVVVKEGTCLEHIPREDLLYWQSTGVGESECVIRKANYTPNQIRRLARVYGWDEDTVHRILGAPGHDGPDKKVREYKARQEGMRYQKQNREFDEHDFREAYLTYPMLKSIGAEELGPLCAPLGDREVRLVVTLHRNTRQVLRVAPYPYNTTRWLIFGGYLRKRAGRGSSLGMSKLLEHFQRGITTMFNQAMDCTTRNNAIWARASNPDMRDFVFQLNKAVIAGKDEFEMLNPGNPVPPNVQLVQLLQAMGERVSGVNDPLLGRETRMGGHPSPATSTLALLGESNKLFAMGLYQNRITLSEVGVSNLNLYRQWMTDQSRVLSAIGKDDAPGALEWLFPEAGDDPKSLEENLKLDLYGVSETMNPDAERQKALMKMTASQNFYAQLLQLSMVAANPQTPPQTKEFVNYAMRAQFESYRDFLESADVDDLSKYLGRLGENLDRQVAAAEKLVDMAQQQLGPGAGAAPPGGAGQLGAGAPSPFGAPPNQGVAGGASPVPQLGMGAPSPMAGNGAAGPAQGFNLSL